MKKYLRWGAVAFLAFYLVSSPNKAAHVVRGALGGLRMAATSLTEFVSAIPS